MNQNRTTISRKLSQSKKGIQGMLKQFKYNTNISHAQNMNLLVSCLQSILNVGDLSDFSKYIGNQEHLPIQFNARALRYQQLVQIIQQWQMPRQSTASVLQRTNTTNFRNILFKSILLDQKNTIDQYFSTISNQNKLKSFDLFQMLTNLLSSYYLYEFNNDSVCFFEKINSIESFVKVVDAYLNQSKRVFSKQNNKQNCDFVHRIQFPYLIEFWEMYNPQLTLLDEPKKNLQDIGIQTILHNQVSVQVQTYRQHGSSLLNLINNTLHEVNIMIQRDNEPYRLKSLSNILNVLREQKISIAEMQRNQQYHTFNHNNNNNSKVRNASRSPMYRTNSRNMIQNPRNLTPSKSESINKEFIGQIYDHLCEKDRVGTLNISELQIFFYNIGLVQVHENHLIKNLLRNGFIDTSQDITYEEFNNIIKQLARQSNRLRNSTLRRYISDHIDNYNNNIGVQQRNQVYITQQQRRLTRKSHSRSDNLELLNKNKNMKLLSKSTYQMDSDDN